ncbi:hypothetical protein OBA42_01255 [Paracoccaceae bacterium]|nr:hypothetical protein [Paracoccaceae bacterium]
MRKLIAILSVVLFANQANADAQKNCVQTNKTVFRLALAKAPYEVMLASVKFQKDLLKDPDDWKTYADYLLVSVHDLLGARVLRSSGLGLDLDTLKNDEFYEGVCRIDAKYWK